MSEEPAYRPHRGQQTAFHMSTGDVFELLFGGEAGPGKTKCLTAEALRQVRHKRYRAIIFRRTNDELEQVRDEAQQMYPAAGGESTDRGNTWKFKSGAKIFLRFMQYESDVFKYDGREFQYIGFDELTHFTEFQYTFMFTRCRTSAEGLLCYIRSSSNPGKAGHAWVKRRFITATPAHKDRSYKKRYYKRAVDPETGQFVEVLAHSKDPLAYSRAFLPANRFDNPSIQDVVMYETQIRALSDPMLAEALLTGNWDMFSGLYFTKFSPQVHVIKPIEIMKWWTLIVGIDWGFHAPCAIEWTAIDDSPVPNVYHYDELYVNAKTPMAIAEMIHKRNAQRGLEPSIYYGGRDMWTKNPLTWKREGTPEYTPHTVAQAFQDEGITITPANQDRKQGWANMHRLMDWKGEINESGIMEFESDGKDRLLDPHYYLFEGRAPHLRDQLTDAVRDEKNVEDIDGNIEDHAIEADRYALMHIVGAVEPDIITPAERELARIKNEETRSGLYARRRY